jgi:hypothetical protein
MVVYSSEVVFEHYIASAARLLSLIPLSQLGTPSFPMTFLLIEIAFVEGNPYVRLILIIRE